VPNVEELQLALKRVEEAARVSAYHRAPDDDDDEPEALFLDAPPESLGWNQAQWVKVATMPEGFCLTAGCLAGHVAIADGYTEPELDGRGNVSWIRNPVTGDTLAFGGPGSVAEYAARKLGLADHQADLLFDEHNSLEDLRSLVTEFCEL
jgi:hypothetical protein